MVDILYKEVVGIAGLLVQIGLLSGAAYCSLQIIRHCREGQKHCDDAVKHCGNIIKHCDSAINHLQEAETYCRGLSSDLKNLAEYVKQ